MISSLLIFTVALTLLLVSARFFTQSAETIGKWLNLPAFVIGVFIVGVGTSLPELISGILSVRQGVSDILPGNIAGSNISNLLLVTGLAIALNKKPIKIGSDYIYIDLHFLIGGFFMFVLIVYDGVIRFSEAWAGILVFIVYSIYLIKNTGESSDETLVPKKTAFPIKAFLILLAAATGIYFGANYTISSLTDLATALQVPNAIIALTVLSLGTTLPELAVNITAIKRGNAEIAVGNVLGSCVFNTLVIPGAGAAFGDIQVPATLLYFSIPVMVGAGLLFYLLTQDKRISPWEGILFVIIYLVFMLKVAGF
ncbi:MAG: sodium:calcium antiporter [Saprospiraceae bacterium]|nr:sodium:calcium antiporter [Saprospiraceae bacterium]